MILVVGATGLVGAEVCERLQKRGHSVRALVRPTSASGKIERLSRAGIQLFHGDLKNPDSLSEACRGVDAIISTASSTLSAQPGDSIESVDSAGQLNLAQAAGNAGVNRFIFVSFRPTPGLTSPLRTAKDQMENAIAGLNFTVIQASWFMDVWLSPALGFDYANATARIYGAGTSPISWVHSRDVAEICAIALTHRSAERKVIEFGGPEPLSPLQVVSRFEKIGGRPFRLEHVPEQALRAQFDNATDSLQKSFSALMLSCASGDAMEMGPVVETYGLNLTSVDDYAKSVLAAERRASA